MKNIILVGIMGCGKTTISKLLSEKLKMPVIDMDKYIEKKYQCTIPDMFAISVETAHRPLLKDGPEKLYQLFDERHQLYLDSCHYHVKNDGTLTDIVNKIVEDID